MNSRISHPIRTLVLLAAALAVAALLAVASSPAQAEGADGDSAGSVYTLGEQVAPKAAKLHAPNFSQANSHLDSVMLSWNLDYDDIGDNPINPDEELIDHFNVYCDGRLVALVDLSAAQETVSRQGGSRSHTWWFPYDPGDRWVLHNFQVSSVAKDGTEGNLSRVLSAEAQDDGVEVVGHQALDNNSSIGLEFKVLGCNSLTRFDLWRSQDTTPPDTSATPYAVISTNRRPEATAWDYWDRSVPADGNYTYTYTVRATDCEGTESNFYTFTVIHSANGGNPSLNPPDVEYALVNNTTPTLTFTAYTWASSGYPTVYKFYRNDQQVGSPFAGTGNSKSFSDTPTVDGTYTYRVDMEVAGITVRGREYTFTLNTKPVALPSKPGTPSLVGRLDSQNKVTLAWTPAETGGEVEGYHIYRRDAGEFVEGSYRRGNYYYLWGLNRYLDVSAGTTSFADIGIPGAADAYLGDYDLGRLTEVWWDDQRAPHEYYVTAYNDYGESAPSNVVTFPYADGNAPLNGDTAAPAAPTITRAWVEWDDDSNSDYYVDGGIFDDNPGYNIRVAWDEPANAAATVSSYRATFDDGGGYVHEKPVPRYGLLNGLHVQDGMSESSPLHHVYAGYENDFNKDFTVIMYAENEAGATASEPVTVRVDGPPRIQTKYDNGAAVVLWADPVFSTASVTGWELYKRPEHGLVAKVGTFGPDTYEYVDADVLDGWTYDYYVVAKTDEGDRRSATASRLISKGDGYGEKVDAPTNLTAKVINGRLVLSWERPANESIYVSFYTAEFKYPDSDEWVTNPYVAAYGGYEGMTFDDVSGLVDKDMQVRVYSVSYGGNESNRSEPASFRITSEQAAAHVEGEPGTVMISGKAGEGWCKVMWSTSTQTNKAPATEYRIKRYDTEHGVYATIGTAAVKGEGSYDYEYIDRYAENGRTYRYMVYPANCGTEANPDPNYNYVELTPTAKTHDQQVAEMVAGLIAALPAPEDVTVDDAEHIGEVKAIWDGLTSDQQKLVKAVDRTLPKKLTDDVAAAEELVLLEQYRELVAPVQQMIDELPEVEDLTLADKAQVEAARTAFEAITPADAKRIVSTAHLEEDEARIAYLEDKLAAEAVDELIAALLPVDGLGFDDLDRIDAVQEAYDALTPAQQELVEMDAEYEAAVQRAADCRAALAVIAAIGELPETTSNETFAADKAQVVAAREAYDALNDDGRTLVGAEPLARLVAAELMIAQNQGAYDEYVVAPVRDAIGQLPDPDDVILEHAEAVTQAKAAFDGLSDSQKALIDEELQDKLQGCADKIDVLQREYATSAGNLAAAITAANNAKKGIATSTDGANVADGKKWTTTAELAALNNAIKKAQAAKADANATKAELDKATSDLKKATSTYNANKKLWHRIWGATAPDTMLNITKRFGKTGYAVVTTDANYKDALAASSLAGRYGAVVLMTKKGSLTPQTKTALKAAGVKNVYIVGSTGNVSKAVEKQLKSGTGVTKVTRIGGSTPAQRAVAAAKVGGKKSDTVIIATQNGFQDALSIAPYSYATKSPILYAETNKKLSNATVNYIKSAKYKKVIIVGGPIALPASIDTQLKKAGVKSITRLAGLNAYATSEQIAKWSTGNLKNGNYGKYKGKTLAYIKFAPTVKMVPNKLAVSTGQNWLDALAGAAFCGKNKSVLLLADAKTSKSNYTLAPAWCKANKAKITTAAYVFGGPSAVQAKVWNALVASTK